MSKDSTDKKGANDELKDRKVNENWRPIINAFYKADAGNLNYIVQLCSMLRKARGFCIVTGVVEGKPISIGNFQVRRHKLKELNKVLGERNKLISFG